MADTPAGAAPTLVSLLICDQVIDDRLTSKKSAIGLFNAILVPRFPATIQQMVVMASITEVQGEAGIELRLVRDADNSVLFRAEERVGAPSPLATVDMVFSLRGIGVPVAGNYAIELLSGGELLGRRRFQVFEQKQRGVPGEQPGGSPDASNN